MRPSHRVWFSSPSRLSWSTPLVSLAWPKLESAENEANLGKDSSMIGGREKKRRNYDHHVTRGALLLLHTHIFCNPGQVVLIFFDGITTSTKYLHNCIREREREHELVGNRNIIPWWWPPPLRILESDHAIMERWWLFMYEYTVPFGSVVSFIRLMIRHEGLGVNGAHPLKKKKFLSNSSVRSFFWGWRPLTCWPYRHT